MTTLKGTLQAPGDKSISHRALIFAALSRGVSRVYGLSPAFDCVSTAECLRQVGLSFEKPASGNGRREPAVLVKSPGLDQLSGSEAPLFAGNSGTTIRLMSGLLAGRPHRYVLDGDESLRRRPMSRILEPLGSMGAITSYLGNEGFAPFAIQGGSLTGGIFKPGQASAQLQASLMLAALQAEGRTTIELPSAVRDHSSRLFDYIGVPYEKESETKISIGRLQATLAPFILEIPADISSAAFFIVAASCLPGSELLLTNVGINPGRVLVLEVLKELGADISIISNKDVCNEPAADILVKGLNLKGSATIDADRLASGIDEIPILALAAALGEASLKVKNASELRAKETDRLAAIIENLGSAGASISETENGFEIEGKGELKGGCEWKTHGDHRMSMTGTIASLKAVETIVVDNESCAGISYPDFAKDLKKLIYN